MQRKNFINFLLSVVLAVSYNIPAKAQSTLAEAKRAIEASNAVYFKAFENNDSSIFIARYAKDCWIMQPNGPTLHGTDARLSFLEWPTTVSGYVTANLLHRMSTVLVKILLQRLAYGSHSMTKTKSSITANF